MKTFSLSPAEWQERIKSNAVYRSMKAVNELAAQIVDGRRNSAIVSGPAGVGKTWAFEEAFKANNIKFQQPRVSSPQALIEALWLDPEGVFLFDECDAMLGDVALLNVLKIATDSKLGPRILEWKTRKEESTIDPFEFKGKIVFLMNSDLHKAAKGKLGPHISALMDRCQPYIMTFDHLAIYEYTCYLAICERMLMREGISREITNTALRFFTETIWRRTSVSPRALTLIARSIRNSPHMWQELAEPMLLREPFCDAPIPPIPEIPPYGTFKTTAPQAPAKRPAKPKKVMTDLQALAQRLNPERKVVH